VTRGSKALNANALRFAALTVVAAAVLVAAFTRGSAQRADLTVEPSATGSPEQAGQDRQQQVERGRRIVIESGCSGCHGGAVTPDQDGWLMGAIRPDLAFHIGPCALQPGAQPCFVTRPRNLTPDNLTGLGSFTERQIFNALRYGLRPGETPDVEITSTTPGQGNFPASPKYLAVPMPWTAYRNLPDADLWAIAAYLKDGVKPVRSRIQDSEGPPDFWAGFYGVETIGTWPAAASPTANEVMPARDADKVRRGRQVVLTHGCGDCHGGLSNPAAKGFLAGVTDPSQLLPLGACVAEPGAQPCFIQRPRNLTPDEATGLGKFSERQIFNALRYGLRPSGTPDVAITSSTPGQGNFPANPDYLSPAMPWMIWRHMSDSDLEAVAAYLKHGLKPVSNKVDDSDRPPTDWAEGYTPAAIGSYPAPAFPATNEVKK